MSGDHNMHQKPRSYLDDFECPRCGHCCKSDLARVGEVGVWGAVQCEPQEEVEDGWCDWVCPKPQGYLMQCCDCELIHEVDFRVVQYEPKPSEVYEVVDDPNLQAQMRLRRRDDLSPKREWVGLTEREVELIDEMIETQLLHAERCDHMANSTMAQKQKAWDLERVELLRKLKEKNT